MGFQLQPSSPCRWVNFGEEPGRKRIRNAQEEPSIIERASTPKTEAWRFSSDSETRIKASETTARRRTPNNVRNRASQRHPHVLEVSFMKGFCRGKTCLERNWRRCLTSGSRTYVYAHLPIFKPVLMHRPDSMLVNLTCFQNGESRFPMIYFPCRFAFSENYTIP